MSKTPFKMNGWSGYQSSPLKDNMSKEEMSRIVEMNKEYKDNPDFQKWKNKKFGGETTISEDSSTITIVKDKNKKSSPTTKKSPAKNMKTGKYAHKFEKKNKSKY